MTNFTTFRQVANYLEGSLVALDRAQKLGLQAAAKYTKEEIQAKHGVRQPGWLASRTNPTPLLRSGELRNAVAYRVSGKKASVYSNKEWLAIIHEFGVTYRMTAKQRKFLFAHVFKDSKLNKGQFPRKGWGSGMITIPARPIWRTVLREATPKIQAILDSYLDIVFP